MDFHLTREQELVRQMMHDFTENEVKPIAAETDKTSTYPRENIEKLFDLGVMGMVVPEEFGGAGADDLSSAIAIEELSKQCASTGDILATHNGLCCGPIIANGTPAQKEKYLRMLTEGHKVGAFALTEPDAGSDAAKGTCVAELQGDHYVLNGSKIFITNGYVRYDRQVQGHQGHFCIYRRELLPGLLCWQARGEAWPARLPDG